ncbi:hypothetical protein [Legionella londiniensis]|nr:hypothetical protein [Legionella londiniensis]
MKSAASILLKIIFLPLGLLASLALVAVLTALLVLLSPILILCLSFMAGKWLTDKICSWFNLGADNMNIGLYLVMQGLLSLASLPFVAVGGPIIGGALALIIIPVVTTVLAFHIAFSSANRIIEWLFPDGSAIKNQNSAERLSFLEESYRHLQQRFSLSSRSSQELTSSTSSLMEDETSQDNIEVITPSKFEVDLSDNLGHRGSPKI